MKKIRDPNPDIKAKNGTFLQQFLAIVFDVLYFFFQSNLAILKVPVRAVRRDGSG